MAVNVDINLNLEGTERSEALLKRMTNTIEAQRQEFERLNRVGRLEGLEQGEKEVNALTRRLASMANEMKRGANESDELVKNLRDVANAAGLVEEKAEGAARAVRNIPSGGGGQKSIFYAGSGTIGDTAGDVGTISSNLAGLTGNQNFAVAGGLGDVIEGTLRLRGSAEELFQSMSGGIASMAVSAAPFLVAGAAVVGTLVAMKEISEAQRGVAIRAINTERERSEALIAQREIVENLTAAEIERQRTSLEFELQVTQQQKARLEQERQEVRDSQSALESAFLGRGVDTLNAFAKQSDSILGGLGDKILPDSLLGSESEFAQRLIELDDKAAGAEGSINDLNEALEQVANKEFFTSSANETLQELRALAEMEDFRRESLTQSTEVLQENISALERDTKRREEENRVLAGQAEGLLESGQIEAYNLLNDKWLENEAAIEKNGEKLAYLRDTALETAQAVERTAQATEAFNEAVTEYERLTKEVTDAQKPLAAMQADIIKAQNELADVQAQRLEDDARNAERARQEQSILDQIDEAKRVSAAAKVADNVTRIREDGYAKEQQVTADYLNDSAKALADYNAQVQDLNAQFQQEDLRATEDYNLARFRLARDLEASLFEAARANDVSAFITARSRGVTQLGDQAVDFGIDRRRASEDQNARLTDLRATLDAEQAERRNAAQVSIAQTRREVTERIATEQAGAVVRITEEQRLQQQLIDLRASFAREDERIRRENQDMALRDAIANAQIARGIQQQTASLLYDQAAAAGRNVGIIMINSFVSGVNQNLAAVAAAGFGAAGMITNSLTIGNISVGNGVSQGQVRQEVQQAGQEIINQLSGAGKFIFSRR